VPPVHGFRTKEKRAEKFYKHVTVAREFDCADDEEYERRAMEFMNRSLDADTKEEVREHDKAIIRCDTKRKIICFVGADGYIKSFFRVRVKDAKAFFERKCKGE
jgi:hypothetical protein